MPTDPDDRRARFVAAKEAVIEAMASGYTFQPPAGRAFTDSMKLNVSQRILAAWMKVPCLRLTQFIMAATGNGDPFFVEDEALAKACEEYVSEK